MGPFIQLLPLLLPIFALVLGILAGRLAEVRHYQSLQSRESEFLDRPALTAKFLQDRPVANARMAVGSVVVSLDYFKRFLSLFRVIFGGELRSYSSLLDRGKREALLRMKESCPEADVFINCRLESSTIHGGYGNTAGGVEVLAYSTAIVFKR